MKIGPIPLTVTSSIYIFQIFVNSPAWQVDVGQDICDGIITVTVKNVSSLYMVAVMEMTTGFEPALTAREDVYLALKVWLMSRMKSSCLK
jgi:hypothetical protein